MKQQNWLLKTLNIREEEAKPVFLMVIFSFFVGLSLSFYFTASNAIFLKHFPPRMIPVSFIASGIIVCLAWWIFSHFDKSSNLSRQVTIKFLFVFLSVLVISIGVWAYDSVWLAFIMYTWVRVMVYITLVNFWGVAGRLFNIRQGKRIFGLISIGEVISIIIGYLSIPVILQFIKVPDLLFLASISLFISLMMVLIIFRTFPGQLNTSGSLKVSQKEIKPEWNYLNLIKKPYFLMISLMALLPIFGYLFVDFLFLAQTRKEFANNPEAIARFFGLFLGAIAILELILKLISGRILNKYGLKPSLLSLPVILLFSIFLAAVFGSLYGMTGMFFAFIALARLFERSIRGALYEPGFQLLYQPVPTDQRLTFQNQIEGIPKALGTVITGAVILLFSSFQAFNLVHFNWLFIVILGFWIWIAFKMYDEYRNMLKSKLSELRHKEQPALYPMQELIRNTLSGLPHQQSQKIESLFEKIEPIGLELILGSLKDKSSVQQEDSEDFTFEYLVELSHSEVTGDRRRAARLLGRSGRYNAYKLLINLIRDPDAIVKKEAIISAGRIRRVELWPLIIENLVIPEFSHTANVAIKIIGEPILQELERFFEKTVGDKPVQLTILRIFESVGGEKSVKFLRDKIYHSDNDIRYQALLSLSNLEYHATLSEIQFIKQTIEDSVETLVWILASLVDIKGSQGSDHLQQALLQELEEKKEHIFLLLSLLYDSKTIGHIRGHIESQDNNAKIYALEISDMMISGEIKELFFPIFEDLSIHERLNRFRIRFPQEKLNLFERLQEIINKEYSKVNKWTKACAINMLGQIEGENRVPAGKLLAANVVNPDPLLSESAAWILYSAFPDYYFATLNRFEKSLNSRFSVLTKKISEREEKRVLLIFEKIVLLKNTEFFAPVDELQILPLIMDVEAPVNTDNHHEKVKDWQQDDIFQITSEEGPKIRIREEKLFEMMTGNPVMTERYIRVFLKNNA